MQTSQRERRANGQWGKLKPLKLRPGQLDDIEREEDRRILAYLSGGSPERTNWFAQQAQLQSSVYRYRIPYELCELILPLMCTTGHVRLIDSHKKSERGLVWDDGPKWELTVRLEQSASGDAWHLGGRLTLRQRNAQLFRRAARRARGTGRH